MRINPPIHGVRTYASGWENVVAHGLQNLKYSPENYALRSTAQVRGDVEEND